MKIFIIVVICLAIFAVLTGADPRRGRGHHRRHNRERRGDSSSSEDNSGRPGCGRHTTASSAVTTAP